MTVFFNSQEIDAWLATPQMQECVRQCTQRAIAAVEERLDLRVPKTEKERRNGFAAWLYLHRARIILVFQTNFNREFARTAYFGRDEDSARNIAFQHLWPQLEQEAWSYFLPRLLRYAMLSQAIAWGIKQYGDATVYSEPIRDGDTWIVSLGAASYGDNLGQIVLDQNGKISEAHTSTRSQFLERVRGIKPPADTIEPNTNATG